jgi:hypothetical protein
MSTDDTTTFYVEGPVGGPFPGAQRPVVLENSGTHSLRWDADATLPWLLFSKDEGQLAAGEKERVVVSIDQTFAATLPAGEYLADVSFRNQDDTHDHIAIQFILTVYEATGGGTLLVTPEDSFETSGDIGGEIETPTKEYRISNVGSAEFRYLISTSEPWVTFTGSSYGTLNPGATVIVTVGFDEALVDALGEGRHQASVEFANVTNGQGTATRLVELTLGGQGRVTEGLQALYNFDEGAGSVVRDVSGEGTDLDLQIDDMSHVQWLPGSLAILSPTRVASTGPASKISQACKAKNEVTVEAWIEPANTTQEGPARIVSVSGAVFERNFSLAQGQYDDLPTDVFDVRVRTTDTDSNGIPAQDTPAGSAKAQLTHVAFTRQSTGVERIYVNGALVHQAHVTGDFSGWNLGYPLTLANEVGTDRPWLGRFHLVAIYGRALTGDEVTQNFNQGTQDPGVGYLSVLPGSDYNISGTAGGHFDPASKTYTLSNTGTAPLDWRASVNASWITIVGDHTNGHLDPSRSTEVTLRVDQDEVVNFTPGSYLAAATFENVLDGSGTTSRDIHLEVSSDGGGGGGDKPGPHNTGPYDESNLQPISGMTITQDGFVLENVDVSGSITIKARNVTIRNFRIDSHGGYYGIQCVEGMNQGHLFEDGEILHNSSCGVYGIGFTARRLEVHEGGGDAFKAHGNVLVEDCWVHNLGMEPDAHADGDQSRMGSNITFRHNNIDMPVGLPGYESNSAFLFAPEIGIVNNILLESNWVNGGNYTVYLAYNSAYGAPTNCRLLNNRFGRDYHWGVLINDSPGSIISGNVWDDTGELMDINNQ